jgi:DNA-binding MarR family transcriptional regulator
MLEFTHYWQASLLNQVKSKGVAKVRTRAPRAGEARRGVEGHIGYLLRQAAAAYRLRLERSLVDLKVTPPQFTVLTMLKAYPGLSNADIARISLLTPPTVTVILRNLEQGGLVSRKQHQTHGRIQQMTLTVTGIHLLARCRKRAEEIETELLLLAKSEAKRQVVKRWLVDVAQSLTDP